MVSLRARNWNEAKHPRDDRGRFARKGGARWAAKVVRQLDARFGDTGMGETLDGRRTDPREAGSIRRDTGPGSVLDLGSIRRRAAGNALQREHAASAARTQAEQERQLAALDREAPLRPKGTFERGPSSASSSNAGVGAPATKRAFAIKVGDRFMHKGAEVEAVGVPRAGRQGGKQVTVVKVRRVADGKTGPVTITDPSVRMAGPAERQDFVEVPLGRTPGRTSGGEVLIRHEARDASGKLLASFEVRAPETEPPAGGRQPGGAVESTDDFLSRMQAKQQAARAAGGVTTSARAEAKPSVHAVMQAAGIDRPDDNNAKSAISRANDRLARGEDPATVAGYLREQARALKLEREEVPESDEQRYAELTQSMNSLARTAKALEVSPSVQAGGRQPGGARVDKPSVPAKDSGVTSTPSVQPGKLTPESARSLTGEQLHAGMLRYSDKTKTGKLLRDEQFRRNNEAILNPGRQAGGVTEDIPGGQKTTLTRIPASGNRVEPKMSAERARQLRESTDPKDNGKKIMAAERGDLDYAELYRTHVAGPSGQRGQVMVGRVRYTPDNPSGEYRVTDKDGRTAGWVTSTNHNGRHVFAVHSEDYDGGTELLGWADSIAHAADVLTNGETAASGSTARNSSSRRIGGGEFERNPNRNMPLEDLELKGARDELKKVRADLANPNLGPQQRASLERRAATIEADIDDMTSAKREAEKPKTPEVPQAEAPQTSSLAKRSKARKGDLVAIERTSTSYTIGKGSETRTDHVFGVVASTDKNGKVTAYSTNPDGSYPHAVQRGEKTRTFPAEQIDVPAVMAAAKAHTYPNSDTPMPFDSLAELQAIARPHVGDQSARLAAERAAAPKGRDPMRLKAGDRVTIPAFRHGDPATTVEVTGSPEAFERSRYDRGIRVPMRVLDGPNAGKEGFHTYKKSDKAQVLPAGAGGPTPPSVVEEPKNAFGFPVREKPEASAETSETRRTRSLATRDGVPPTDGRPDITAVATGNSKGRYHRWDLASSKGRDRTMAPDVARAYGGKIDDQPAAAEVLNPVDGKGDYRYRIFNENTGATIEEGTSPDAAEAFRFADRIFDERGTGGMARSKGAGPVRFEARQTERPKDASRGDIGRGPFYDNKVYQINPDGSEREASSHLRMSDAERAAADRNDQEIINRNRAPGADFLAETKAALADADPRRDGSWNLPDKPPAGATIPVTRNGTIKAPRAKASPVDVAAKLRAANTRAEADAIMADVKGAELRQVAEAMNVHIGGLKADDARARLVERAVGSRLNSEALRGGVRGAAYLGGAGGPDVGGRTPEPRFTVRPVAGSNGLYEAVRVDPDGTETMIRGGVLKGAAETFAEMAEQMWAAENGVKRESIGDRADRLRREEREREQARLASLDPTQREIEQLDVRIANLRRDIADEDMGNEDAADEDRPGATKKAWRAELKQLEARQATLLGTARGRSPGGQPDAPTFTSPQPEVYDKLLATEGPTAVTHKQARQIVEQMEAHGWKMTGGPTPYGVTTWKAPDGRELTAQSLFGEYSAKPTFREVGYNGRELTFKAALARVVTPTPPETSPAPDVDNALRSLGLPELPRQYGMTTAPTDPYLRPLYDASQGLMPKGAYGGRGKTLAEVTAELRRSATMQREAAQKADELYGFGGRDMNSARREQAADTMERVAAELERLDTTYRASVAERERVKALPPDIRPGRFAGTAAAGGRAPGGGRLAAPVRTFQVEEAHERLREIKAASADGDTVLDPRTMARNALDRLTLPELAEVHKRLLAEEAATPFNQGGLKARSKAKAIDEIVELAVGRNADSLAIGRAVSGRTPGGKA